MAVNHSLIIVLLMIHIIIKVQGGDIKCGKKLLSILNDLCGGRFNGPNGCSPKRNGINFDDNFISHRQLRDMGIVEECCLQSCSVSDLTQYCC